MATFSSSQINYEIIMDCIKHGAPAIAEGLMAYFNKTIENSNAWGQYQAKKEEKRKQEEMKLQQQGSIDQQAEALKNRTPSRLPQ